MNTIDIETINPFDLPSVELEQRSNLPEKPGIYFCVRKGVVVYIGISVNSIRERWSSTNHHRLPDMRKLGGVQISYLEISANERILKAFESELCDKWQPRFNDAPSIELYRRRIKSGEQKIRELTYAKEAVSRTAKAASVSQSALLLGRCYDRALTLERFKNTISSIESMVSRFQYRYEQKAKELEKLIAKGDFSEADLVLEVDASEFRDLCNHAVAVVQSVQYVFSLWRLEEARDIESALEEYGKRIAREMSKTTEEVVEVSAPEEFLAWYDGVISYMKESMPDLFRAVDSDN